MSYLELVRVRVVKSRVEVEIQSNIAAQCLGNSRAALHLSCERAQEQIHTIMQKIPRYKP